MTKNTILQQSIIEELELQNLPQEKQDELMAKMAEVVIKRIYIETMKSLGEADREKLAKMLDAESEPEKIEEFLKMKIGNYEEVVKKIIEDFKNEMKGAAGKFDDKYKE